MSKVLPIIVFMIVTFSIIPLQDNNFQLKEESERRDQLGGDGSIEERCQELTFEDIFEYTKADFNFLVDEDWIVT